MYSPVMITGERDAGHCAHEFDTNARRGQQGRGARAGGG